jgi:1A family penicillin-binding protein
MESLLVKIFATALALSQVTTAPDAVKTDFNRDQDQEQVAQILRDGCAHMRKAFDIEDINIDSLIATAMDDPQAIASSKAFRNIKFSDLQTAYREFCKNERVDPPAVDLGQVIDFYNKSAANLPDPTKLRRMKFSGASVILDGKGEHFTDVYRDDQRRVWVQLSEIPEHVRNAFIAAEDKRFYQHKGIDERGMIRAFIGNLAQSGRPQGGSTITQQIVKNLLVGDDLSYERKIAEMIVASRVEATLSKDEILELYLNSVFLGRGSWGIELAARNYFGKTAKELSVEEGALLAGLTKGPNYYSPARHPERAQERLAYVLGRMKDGGSLASQNNYDQEPNGGVPPLPRMVPYERRHRDTGYYFADQVAREVKTTAGLRDITTGSYTVRSTIDQQLQRAVEGSLQEGLSRYERSAGRVRFQNAEMNLAEAVSRIEADPKRTDSRPTWQQALANAPPPLYDVHWTPAVVLERGESKKGGAWSVGLVDGRILRLSIDHATARKLTLYDVVLVRIVEETRKAASHAELRVRPEVQGTIVVLENKTGRILAMTGGFSYPLSQLNRATQAERQPGSAIKPLSYLAALGKGLQPNTLLSDDPITLPPIGRERAHAEDYWSPKNYDGGGGGTVTLRQALERSRNLATVHLLDGGIESKPEASLNRVCDLAVEAQIYRDCLRFYPVVLGAQAVRPIDLAAFYAAIANEGLRPSPHVVESIERNGENIFHHEPALEAINSVDHAAFYQLKTIMRGVLARGTARSISGLSPFVAGKTGTTDDENDAWFVGFTNEVTVAVWIGYDNANGKRRTLGGGVTGGGVAVPIFESVIEAVWANSAKTALAPPSAEAKRQLACKSTDLESGEEGRRVRNAITECFRINRTGKIIDTQYQLVAHESASDREAGFMRKRAESTKTYAGRTDWSRDPWQATQSNQREHGWEYGSVRF